MQKKLTITIDEQVYAGLQTRVGRRRISHFIESLVRPHVLLVELDAAYAEMAADEAREADALEWAEATLEDVSDAPLTSNVARLYPSEASVSVNDRQHKAMADQLATVSKLRLNQRIGSLSPQDLHQTEQAIKLQLGL